MASICRAKDAVESESLPALDSSASTFTLRLDRITGSVSSYGSFHSCLEQIHDHRSVSGQSSWWLLTLYHVFDKLGPQRCWNMLLVNESVGVAFGTLE